MGKINNQKDDLKEFTVALVKLIHNPEYLTIMSPKETELLLLMYAAGVQAIITPHNGKSSSEILSELLDD